MDEPSRLEEPITDSAPQPHSQPKVGVIDPVQYWISKAWLAASTFFLGFGCAMVAQAFQRSQSQAELLFLLARAAALLILAGWSLLQAKRCARVDYIDFPSSS